jgi:peptidyl-prolyl cis-trans isomerase B (cyclophilin B)
MTRIATTIGACVLALGCGPKGPVDEPAGAQEEDEGAVTAGDGFGTVVTEKLSEETLPAELYMHVQVRERGLIVVELFPADAPKNVTNVANLAIEGFYDGLSFHRIVPGFVVQGGDPEGTGAGGLGYTVEAEISRKHVKGCMAMARKSDEVNPQMESSSCQFYFCLEPLEKLDGKYTVVGRIVEGMDVMDAMGEVLTDDEDRPLEDLVMEKAWITER